MRYRDALWRHLLAEPESGLLHLAHAAWNALAVLERELQMRETVCDALDLAAPDES